MRISTICSYFFLFIIITCFSCGQNDEKTLAPAAKENADEKLLRKEVAQYPDSLSLVEDLAALYRDNGNYDSAIAVTDRALQKNQDVAELWDIKATLHYENEDTANAIKALETAINIYPLPEYIISLGTIYAQTKNAKALTMANALLLADKAKAAKEAFFIKGLYYNYTGDKKKAMNLFDSCIRLDYTYMFAYREKAIALYDLGRYEDALKVLEKAVTIQNNFDEGYYWMGKCYQKLSRKEDAIQSYHTALMYDKDFIEARDSLKVLEGK